MGWVFLVVVWPKKKSLENGCEEKEKKNIHKTTGMSKSFPAKREGRGKGRDILS